MIFVNDYLYVINSTIFMIILLLEVYSVQIYPSLTGKIKIPIVQEALLKRKSKKLPLHRPCSIVRKIIEKKIDPEKSELN